MTVFEIVDHVWERINNSSLKAAITGKVYKHERPAGSVKEDIVINCLPINNVALQQTVVNVNIYVPRVTVTVNKVTSQLPDHTRFKALAALADEVFNDVFIVDADLGFDVQQHVLIQEQNGEYYLNIRIETYNINLN